jgi:hypothetical protein
MVGDVSGRFVIEHYVSFLQPIESPPIESRMAEQTIYDLV